VWIFACPRLRPLRYDEGAPDWENTMADARRRRILVIDDDANVREVLLHLLASFGYDVHASADPQSGLTRFKEGGWDLVLVDVVMPAMSGWVVVERIRQ
jgi:CheY-like chemotaxis protein